MATIQVEQDEIIRLDHPEVLVSEGGPGTGKTVVALHRVILLGVLRRGHGQITGTRCAEGFVTSERARQVTGGSWQAEQALCDDPSVAGGDVSFVPWHRHGGNGSPS